MIFHLYGPDSYRRKRKLRELLADYFKKYPTSDLLDLDFEGADDAWEKARDFLNQPSMFTPSKVLIARESAMDTDGKKWAEVLKKYAEEPKTFIFISDGGKAVKTFDFLLKKPVRSLAFEELGGAELKAFVLDEAAARGLQFTPEALQFFLGFVSSAKDASWNTINELEKISLMELAQPMDLRSLQPLIEWNAKTAVFEGTRAIMWSRTRAEKLKALEKLFIQKEAAAYIFNSLGFGARGKDAVRLADYDVSVKSGGLDYEEALLDFVIGN
jgi:DNA polymerase III delta subunit